MDTKIVAIASSTGGPRALQMVLTELPADFEFPVLVVQHMPEGFTDTLAGRLNELCGIRVKEAAEGEEIKSSTVYLSKGGKHMTVVPSQDGRHAIHYLDDPVREGVKPCANYLYESLQNCRYEQVICAVLTGMGADGTEGILALRQVKPVYVIAQDRDTSTVYGMPKNIVQAGAADVELPLGKIGQEIVRESRSRQNGGTYGR